METYSLQHPGSFMRQQISEKVTDFPFYFLDFVNKELLSAPVNNLTCILAVECCMFFSVYGNTCIPM